MKYLARLKNEVFIAMFFLITHDVFAVSVETQLRNTATKAQKVLMAAIPIFMISIAYLYKRGKAEAKDRVEGLVIGGILAATAFGWAHFFK